MGSVTDEQRGMITLSGLGAFLCHPGGSPRGGMLLLPMISGISAQLREYADSLATLGVVAMSWDPWRGRPGGDETPMDTLFQWMSSLDDEECLAEMGQLLDHLYTGLGCQRVGVIGWCMGGRFALLLGGRDDRLASVIAYHPTVPDPPAPNHVLDAGEYAARIGAPVMMLYPGADDLVPQESFVRLQGALHGRASGPSIVHVYPGAEHGFSARARQDKPVNKLAFELSWPQVLAFVRASTC